MKAFLIFLLLLPMASAVAVSPTSLDLGAGETGEIHVFNTLDRESVIQTRGVHSENFTLGVNESRVLRISVAEDFPGRHESVLLVEELYDNGLVNAISIPVSYYGHVPGYSTRTIFGIPFGKEMFSAGLIAIITILALAYAVKKRKKNGKNSAFKDILAKTFK